MYHFAIIFTLISLNVHANDHTTLYSDSFSFRSNITKKINVYGKGYRYQNRIYYREKLNAKKQCQQDIKNYRNNQNSKALNLEAKSTDLSIRVGMGRLSSVQFACDLEFKTISGARNLKIDSYVYDFKNIELAKEFCTDKLKELKPKNYIASHSVYKKSKSFICAIKTVNSIQ